MSIKTILVIPPLLCLFVAVSVAAVGLKVWPAELKEQAEQEVLKTAELVVENPNTNAALYEVYLDIFSDWIKIKPESFILESGEAQKVVLEIKAKQAGIFSALISVLAKPFSEREFQAGSGIKIPLEIRVVQKSENLFLANLTQGLDDFFGWGLMLWTALIVFIVLAAKNLFKGRQPKFGDCYDSPVVKF